MAEQANDVYKKFHPDLLEADLPIESLIKQLQDISLVTDDHMKELEACDTQTTRIQYVLDRLIESNLKTGDTKSFTVLMKVMEESDDADLILLAKEMKIMCNAVPNDLNESNDRSDEPIEHGNGFNYMYSYVVCYQEFIRAATS